MYNWKNNPAEFHAPNGESMSQVYDRVKKAVLRIVADNPNKTICIVSHGCAIKNMMCFAHDLEVKDIKQVPLGTNTSVNIVSFDEQLKPTIILENYTDHFEIKQSGGDIFMIILSIVYFVQLRIAH